MLICLLQKSLIEQIHNPRILTIDGSDYWTKEIIGEVSLSIEQKNDEKNDYLDTTISLYTCYYVSYQ